MTEPIVAPEETPDENDRALALAGYLVPLVALLVLFTDAGRRRFARYHAVQSLVYVTVVVVVWFVMVFLAALASLATFFIGGIGGWLVGLGLMAFMVAAGVVALLYGIQAYQGRYCDIPWVTAFVRQQRWL